jgi:hypothetical protein
MKEIRFDPADFEPVRAIALTFPGAFDSLSHYDTPSVKVGKNLLCRLHEEGRWIAFRTDFESRDSFLDRYPESCFITEHYRKYPYICVHTGNYTPGLLRALLETGYHAITRKKEKPAQKR